MNATYHAPSDEGLAYFYCDRNDTSIQQPLHILRSFIRQLSICGHMETIQQSIYNLYKAKQRKGFASNGLKIGEYQKALLNLAKIRLQRDPCRRCARRM